MVEADLDDEVGAGDGAGEVEEEVPREAVQRGVGLPQQQPPVPPEPPALLTPRQPTLSPRNHIPYRVAVFLCHLG